MGRIKLLSQAVADRIAAGEVVERPASIVRELLDNALDAGAQRIEVDLEGGGADAVSVTDDGCGMGPDDAVLAFERHATSKIFTGDDLDVVQTMGFRGEALAAIAAVARVELLTRSVDDAAATRVVVERGRLLKVEPAGRAAGTTLSVRDLFAGIPARRKFLKGTGTELEHCLAAAEKAALARWEVGFRVRHNGRELLAAPPVPEAGARLADVLGSRTFSALVPGRDERGPIRTTVWAGRADVHRPNRGALQLFVNRRPVRDPLLVRAVLDAYRPYLPAGRFPVVVLFLEMPPELLDVNVHPAKSEVRFYRPQDVRGAVTSAIGLALATRSAIPYLGGPASTAFPSPAPGGAERPPLRDAPFGQATPDPSPPPAFPGHVPAVRAIAQYRNCYILAEDQRGLLVVDQHVAHERLLYEQLLKQADQGPLARQSLLFPEPLEIGPAGVEMCAVHRDPLTRAGFGVEPFGPAAVVVREVPAIYGREARPESLSELLHVLEQDGRQKTAELLFQRLLATVACHTAVRKSMPLSAEKMNYILQGLNACEAPSHCPHGRVVSLRVDLSTLDRGFDRTS